jgi:hypothetical protein
MSISVLAIESIETIKNVALFSRFFMFSMAILFSPSPPLHG